MVTKICEECGKQYEAFGRQKYCSPECKAAARKKYLKIWRDNWPEEKKEARKAYSKKWYKENPEYYKEYYKSSDNIKKSAARYYKRHKRKISEKAKLKYAEREKPITFKPPKPKKKYYTIYNAEYQHQYYINVTKPKRQKAREEKEKP